MRVALAGGGTGGHIVPGLHLVERASGSDVPRIADLLWFTSGRPIEDVALAGFRPEFDWERVVLELEPRGGGAPSRARLLFRTWSAFRVARRGLRRHRTEVLLGLGGFTTLPVVLAARTLGIPVALLEINAAPGKATRLLTSLARRVYHAWSATLPAGGEDRRHRRIGAPVSPAVSAVRGGEEHRRAASEALGFDPARPLLLILGGSQGAASLNAFVQGHGAKLVDAGLQVLHQCGPGRRDDVGPELPGLRVEEYLSPIAPALSAATLVLCRGGASTLAEIAAARVPAWVVPYPHHADRHQERNAAELGAGVRQVEDDCLNDELARELAFSAGDEAREEREAMSRALGGAVPADAAAELLTDLARLARVE